MRIDAQKAEEYLWMAAEAGEPEAQLQLAKKIMQGKLLHVQLMDKLMCEERSPVTLNGSPLSAKISNSGNLGASLSQSQSQR